MITADTLLDIDLFASVPQHERETIASRAADVQLRTGDWLIHEGERPSFFAVLSGGLDVYKRVGREDELITTFDPGEFFGEVPLLLNVPAVAGVRARVPSRIARLDEPDFRELIISCDHLRERIVETMTRRVGTLQQATSAPTANVTIVGNRYDLECYDVRDFLARNHVPFRWDDPDDGPVDLPEGAAGLSYPIVIFNDPKDPAKRSFLSEPDNKQMAIALGMQTEPERDRIYDVVVVGAGPAGLAAGVYGASEGLDTLLVERAAPGGQAGSSSRIENYLGFPAGVSGDELSTRAWDQAKRLGAAMLSARTVETIEPGGDGAPHRVVLDGERIAARAIVLASGVEWRRLEADGVSALTGRGVYYGAARTEASLTRGKDIYLIGGGNSAGQAAMFFASYAANVTLVVRATSLEKSMSKYLIDQLDTKANVRTLTESVVVAALGSDHLEKIVIEHVRTGVRQTHPTGALFILIGAEARTAALPPAIVRDADGYICTGRDVLDLETPGNHHWPLERDPYLLETSVPGIFAAGDVRHGSIKRVASGVGEGSMSIAFIHQYLDEVRSRAKPAPRETDRRYVTAPASIGGAPFAPMDRAAKNIAPTSSSAPQNHGAP